MPGRAGDDGANREEFSLGFEKKAVGFSEERTVQRRDYFPLVPTWI